MQVVDLAAHVAERPEGEFDPTLRVDGVHFASAGAFAMSKDWLRPEIQRVARDDSLWMREARDRP